MDYRLGSLGNSSSTSGSSDLKMTVGPSYSRVVRTFFSFLPAVLLSILTIRILHISAVSLSYFILAVPIRKCLGKHLHEFTFPIATLNGTLFIHSVKKMKTELY